MSNEKQKYRHPFVMFLLVKRTPKTKFVRREIIFIRTLLLQSLYRALKGDKKEIEFLTSSNNPVRKKFTSLAGVDDQWFVESVQRVLNKEFKMPQYRQLRYIWCDYPELSNGEKESDEYKVLRYMYG